MASSSGKKSRVTGPSLGTALWHNWREYRPDRVCEIFEVSEAYAKLSLRKNRPIAVRNEEANVFSGLL